MMGLLKELMARSGGLKGLAAGAAIAWGTAQATAIASEATEARALAEEQVEMLTGQRDAMLAEMTAISAESLAKTGNAVREAILAGKYDNTVQQRYAQLHAEPAETPEIPGQLSTVDIDFPRD